MKKILLFLSLFSLVLAGCSNFSHWGKRDVASTDEVTEGTKVFRHQDSTVEIPKTLEGLQFGDDKQNGESIGKIIAFINNNRDMILSSPEASKSPILRFYPDRKDLIGRIYSDDSSVSIRLQQAVYFYKGEQKFYVPYEGAEIVAHVRAGKLESLNSALVVPFEGKEAAEVAKAADFEDLKSISEEDRAHLFRSMTIHKDEEDQKQAFSQLFDGQKASDKKGWLSKFLKDSNVVFRFMKKLQDSDSSRVKLVYSKRSQGSDYELVWHVDSPFGLPVQIYYSADKKQKQKFVKSYSHLTDAKVLIYRGFLLKPDLLKIKSGESTEWAKRPVSESTSDSKEALINISKAVEYFKGNFNWNSYDNQGSPVKATVKLGGKMLSENAAWIGSPFNQFVFGKGGTELGDFTAALDVIGHEYFHSIVSNTAKLESAGQHGGLNEHLADIFGVGFESEVTGKAYDQKIGEIVILKNKGSSNPIGLRDFLHPDQGMSEQLTTMQEIDKYFGDSCVPSERNDRCGVHFVNGLPNMAMGKFIQDKGWPQVKKMVFNVVAKRLRSSSDFIDYKNQLAEECKVTPNMSTADCRQMTKYFEDLGLVESAPSVPNKVNPGICEVIKDSCKMLREYKIEPTDSCRQCGF